jgi:ABC-type Fe3+-hydroxamate transport system substrate-binding protein
MEFVKTLMSGLRTVLAFTSLCILAAGCGSPSNTSGTSSGGANPAVIVTIDGARQACVVALAGEPQGSTVPCDDVVPFLRDELRVPSGSTYDIRGAPSADKTALAKVDTSLRDGGYLFIGGLR